MVLTFTRLHTATVERQCGSYLWEYSLQLNVIGVTMSPAGNIPGFKATYSDLQERSGKKWDVTKKQIWFWHKHRNFYQCSNATAVQLCRQRQNEAREARLSDLRKSQGVEVLKLRDGRRGKEND